MLSLSTKTLSVYHKDQAPTLRVSVDRGCSESDLALILAASKLSSINKVSVLVMLILIFIRQQPDHPDD